MRNDQTEPLAEQLAAALRTLLPPGVAVATTGFPEQVPALQGAEAHAAGAMGDRRRREFAAGRLCGRQALAALSGGKPAPIPRGPDRAPVWPSGYVGSITHSQGLAAAAVAPMTALAGIGIDLEEAAGLEPGLVRRIALPAELEAPPQALSREPAKAARVLFSAKESVYKCLAPLTGRFLEFHDVELLPRDGAGGFRARTPGLPELAPWMESLRVEWWWEERFVVSVAWLPATRRTG